MSSLNILTFDERNVSIWSLRLESIWGFTFRGEWKWITHSDGGIGFSSCDLSKSFNCLNDFQNSLGLFFSMSVIRFMMPCSYLYLHCFTSLLYILFLAWNRDNFDLSYGVARILLASCRSWIFKALNIELNQLLFLDFHDVKLCLLLHLCIMFESDAHLWKNKANLRDLIVATGLVISNWIQIVNFSACVTVKFDGWPCKTIRHLFYATSSFVHHFLPIGEFILELQSENAQFRSKSTIFLAVWPRNFTDDPQKQ